MSAHRPLHQRLHRRQDAPEAPTGNGVDGATTIDTAAGLDIPTLAIDPNASPGVTGTAPPLAGTNTPVITTSRTAPATTASSTEVIANQGAVSSSGKNSIPMSTVVGACLGALAGCIIIVLGGLFVYKRTAPKRRARQPRTMVAAYRNNQGDNERRRSRLENWNKLGDIDDKWEAKYQTQQVTPTTAEIAPMEKLTMFKSPSIRTAYTHRSEEQPAFDLSPHPFSAYHPGLAQDMATDKGDRPSEPVATTRPFLGRVDVGPAISWDSQGSFHSFNSGAPASGLGSTPHVTSSEQHVWQSAEVVEYDEVADSHTNNPFNDKEPRNTSHNNPFFSAQATTSPVSPKSKSQAPPQIVAPKVDKGKARDLTGSSADPFGDENRLAAPPVDTLSVSGSVSSNDRALQSLIAALDLAPEEERLRVTSLQPSIITNASAYTSGGEDDVTQAFPLPPGPYNKP